MRICVPSSNAFLADADHSGKAGTIATLPRPLATPRRVLLVGVGDGDEHGWRAAGAALARAAAKDDELTVILPESASAVAARGLAEGLWLASYTFNLTQRRTGSVVDGEAEAPVRLNAPGAPGGGDLCRPRPGAIAAEGDRAGRRRGRSGSRLRVRAGRGVLGRDGDALRSRSDQHAERGEDAGLVRGSGDQGGGGQGRPGCTGVGRRGTRRRRLRRCGRGRQRLDSRAPAGPTLLATARRGRIDQACRPGRQRHHVRHRRHLHQAAGRHEADAQRHGRRRGHHRGHVRRGRAEHAGTHHGTRTARGEHGERLGLATGRRRPPLRRSDERMPEHRCRGSGRPGRRARVRGGGTAAGRTR